MLSIWERKKLVHFDFIIVGGGLVGMHTALQLRKRFKRASICILERSVLPSGASTRNAGFACMGSLSELIADRAIMSDDEIVNLYLKRKEGLHITRKLFGDQMIDYREEGSYELISNKEIQHLAHLDYFNQLLSEQLGYPPFVIHNEYIAKSGFNGRIIKYAIENIGEGSIDTGKLINNMLHLLKQKNIEIKTGAKVDSFEKNNTAYDVHVYDETLGFVAFNCQQLVICTNAFTKDLLPQVDVKPGRGQVIITKPLLSLPFKGVYHMDEGYYYFRNYKNRILLGGGRNKDFEKEATTELGDNKRILNDLRSKLGRIILPGREFEIDFSWSGIMAFGAEKYPIVQKVDDGLFVAVRGGGMGVALSSVMARDVVCCMTE